MKLKFALYMLLLIFFSCKKESNSDSEPVFYSKISNFSYLINSGQIEIIHNGTGVYFYSIDSGKTFQKENVFSNLFGGTYSIAVRNPNNQIVYGSTYKIIAYPKSFNTETLIDERDGQHYQIVKIGNQWWMQQNLNYGKKIISTENHQTNNNEVEKFAYNDSDDKLAIYGGMYQWNEAMMYTVNQDVCPEGWHIPSDKEWNELELSIGLNPTDTSRFTQDFADRGTGIASKLVFLGISGFNSLPGGGWDPARTDKFYNAENYSSFWTSSSIDSSNAISHAIGFYDDRAMRYRNPKIKAFSIRCVKDENK